MEKILVFGLFLITSTCLFSAEGLWRKGVISKNVDGDTVWVNIKKERLKIRMHGIDAPETNLPGKGGPWSQGKPGEEASKYMKRLVPLGSEVQLLEEERDKYGRPLSHIIRDGKNIELAMIESGWAIPYIICSGKTCNDQYLERELATEFFGACQRARENGLGIFNPKDPLTEMPFEFRLRIQEREPDKFVGDFETRYYFDPQDYEQVDVCRRVFFDTKSAAQRAGFQPFNEPPDLQSVGLVLADIWKIEYKK